MDLGYLILIRARHRRRRRAPLYQRILVVRSNAFDIADEIFISLFRMSKNMTREIMNLLNVHLARPTLRHNAVPVGVQVLLSLRILASGSFQNVVGESLFHKVRQPTVSKIFSKFLEVFLHYRRQYIDFPRTNDQIEVTKRSFQEKYQFPGCVGCIDCTHVYIQKPHEEHWNAFLNRKGRYSLNIQMVCDSNMKIIDVVAQYPGSVHDSFIYNNCGLRRFLHSPELPPNTWLLGDKGYPLEHCLLTPFRNPNNLEERFNVAHKHTRNLIERVFGVLKSVWRILHDSGGNLLYKHSKVIKIIICCVMLHNIRRAHNFPENYDDYDIENLDHLEAEVDNVQDINYRRGEAVRQWLVLNRFRN